MEESMTTERRAQQHEQVLRHCLRALAGDLLRAIAGGSASKIVERIGEANEAIENWFDGRQCMPFGQRTVEAMLWLEEDRDGYDDHRKVEHDMIIAALRTVSARMLPMPHIRNDWFKYEDINALAELRKKRREQMERKWAKWRARSPEHKQPANDVLPKANKAKVNKTERRIAIRKQARQAQRSRMGIAATPIEGD